MYWTYDKGPVAEVLGEGLTSPHRKNPACYKMLHRASDYKIYVPCGMHRREDMHTQSWLDLKGIYNFEDMRIDERIMLEWMLGE
jgi:hypothetical protein